MRSILTYIFGYPDDDVVDSNLLTNKDKRLVRKTWDILRANSVNTGVAIMTRYFNKYPQYHQVFPAFKDILVEHLASNKKFHAHCQNIVSTLSNAIDALDDTELMQEILHVTGERHGRRGQGRQEFVDLKGVMMDVMKDVLKSKFSAEVEAAWDKTIDVLFSKIFGVNMKPNGRSAMEMTLRWLGRPDLAKYVRENHRSINYFDAEDYDIADTLEFPGHIISRRHTSEKDKHSHNHRRKKKKKKRHHDGFKVQNKGIQKAMVATAAHAAKYNWSNNKEDKDTFTDCLEWDDDAVCSCSDIEGGCVGKCAMCSQNDQNHKTSHRTGSDDSINDLDYARKMKKKKKRQRFSFLQKSFSNKKREKDKENRDRKKTLDKIIVRKHEKTPSISKKEQCACCRCAISSKDKMLRERKENEKRELHKSRVRRKKEERRRRKEELRKIEKHANVCFNETCK